MSLDAVLSSPQILAELARGAGAGTTEARQGLEALLPAVSRALERNAGSSGGLESLIGALASGRHDRYVDAPGSLADAGTRTDGNAILGHIFGSKDVSRNVAAHASQETGLDSDLLKRLLPLVASVAMGYLSKQSGHGDSLRRPSPSSGDLLGSVLGGLLGGGGGGSARETESPLDDILDLAKKFL
ncbi:MAG: DUF937 domain-containing protein [Myxococcota bacterium]